MKQTAVQWLVAELIKLGYLHSSDYGNSPKVLDALNQANAMHEEQIKDAYEQGESDAYKQLVINIDKKYESFEQYYKETYNNNDRNSG